MMEVTACNIEPYISLLLYLLKVFSMFQMSLILHKHNEVVLKAIDIQCSNSYRNTCFTFKG